MVDFNFGSDLYIYIYIYTCFAEDLTESRSLLGAESLSAVDSSAAGASAAGVSAESSLCAAIH